MLGGIIFYYRIVNGVSKNAVVRELQTNLSKQRKSLSLIPSFKSKPFIQHKNKIGYKLQKINPNKTSLLYSKFVKKLMKMNVPISEEIFCIIERKEVYSIEMPLTSY